MALVEESVISIADSKETSDFLDFFDQSPVEEELIATEPKTALPKLARVPDVLSDDESVRECFTPKFVSIGPYYHGHLEYQESEGLKKKRAKNFISTYGRSARRMYYKLYSEIEQIRDFYEIEWTQKYDDECLTRMLFVDGCFLSDFIFRFPYYMSEVYTSKENSFKIVLQDSCLLENQLPFLVLKLLNENYLEYWDKLVARYITFIGNCFTRVKGSWIRYNLKEENSSHLFELLRIGFRGSYVVHSYYENEEPNAYNYSVTELKEMGIYCKPSSRDGLKCIRFSSYWFYGVLELPSIEVGLLTRGTLLNLIAYEMRPDVDDLHIQSYVHFLASILHQPQDVKALREALILKNQIGSDYDVVQLFKELSAKASSVTFGHIEIQMQIGRYLNGNGRTKIWAWLAEVLSVYFRSPWSTVTVFAGFLVLSATIIQTVLQIVSYKKNLE